MCLEFYSLRYLRFCLFVVFCLSSQSVFAKNQDALLQPISQIALPVESGGLDQHLNLQFNYTTFSLVSHGSSIHSFGIAIEGQ